MRDTMTISIPSRLKKQLDALAKREGLNRSDIVRQSLADYFFLRRFDECSAQLTAEARANGIFTEDDVRKRLGTAR